MSLLSASCHQLIDGVLGADFFRGRIVQIDFAASRVRLLRDCDLNLANCGNGLLSRFRLTIDEPGSRVIFEKVR